MVRACNSEDFCNGEGMATSNLIQVAPPSAADSAQWWPDLFLKKGRQLQAITTEQCAVVRELYNAGRGASEIRKDVELFDADGEKIGHVSYNGRVWLHDIGGNIEVPQRGIKTAVQRDAEGWR